MSCCLKWLHRLLVRPDPPELPLGKRWVVDQHQSWGKRISYRGPHQDGKRLKWDGHTTPRPKLYDLLEAPMKAGGTATFQIIGLQLCRDPTDMWFATTSNEPIERNYDGPSS